MWCPFPRAGIDLNRGSSEYAIRPFNNLVADVEVEAASEENEEDSRGHPCGEEEEECDERTVKRMQSPLRPTTAEVDDHNLPHFPYRSWCRHCVRGR